MIAINGMPDHIHILLGMKPDIALSDLVRDIKANSSKFVNERNFVTGKFVWQQGFGAFTLGHSQMDIIIQYINKQEEHHVSKTFKEEYVEFLKRYEIEFNTEYIFDMD